MFESLVASLVSSRLTQFVKKIDTEKLKLGVWHGEVKLKDLELREDCLDGLGLPVAFKAGYVGSLRIQIPWGFLMSKPVVVDVERIHFIFRIEEGGVTYGEEAAAKYAEIAKQAAIAAAELSKRASAGSFGGSLFTRLIERMIGLVRVRVSDLHARVEVGTEVSGGPPYAIGVVCESASTKASEPMQVCVEVCGAAVYWDRGAEPTECSGMALEQVAQCFAEWGNGQDGDKNSTASEQEDEEGDVFYIAPSEDENANHQWLVHPVELKVKVNLMRHDAAPGTPKVALDIDVKPVSLCLEVGQFWDLLRLVDWLMGVDLRKKHGRLRPTSSVLRDPQAWWAYAIQISREKARQRSSRWSWARTRITAGQKREYMELYRQLLLGKSSQADKKQLAYLESELSVEIIMFCRSVAEELVGKQQNAGKEGRGWLQWGLRWMRPKGVGQEGDGGEDGGDGEDGEDADIFTLEQENFLHELALSLPEGERHQQTQVLEGPEANAHAESQRPPSPDRGQTPATASHCVPSPDRPTPASQTPRARFRSGSDALERLEKDALFGEGRPSSFHASFSPMGGAAIREKKRRNRVYGLPMDVVRGHASFWFGQKPPPSDDLLAKVHACVEKVVATLAVRFPEEDGDDIWFTVQEIVSISLSDIHANVSVREALSDISVGISTLQMRDRLSISTSYPLLISSAPPPLLHVPAPGPSAPDGGPSPFSPSRTGEKEVKAKAIVCEIKASPSTTKVAVKIPQLEVVLAPEPLLALGTFFVPEYEIPFYENRLLDSLNQIPDCPGRLASKLEYVVGNASGGAMNLSVELAAPRIVVPIDVSRPGGSAFVVQAAAVKITNKPYLCGGYTQEKIMASANAVYRCSRLDDRKKMMQKMFYMDLDIAVHRSRILLADIVPPQSSDLLCNPRLAQVGCDLVLPIKVLVGLKLTQLNADATMPMLYLAVHVPELTVQADAAVVAHALEAAFQPVPAKTARAYKELSEDMNEQARRATMGLPLGGRAHRNVMAGSPVAHAFGDGVSAQGTGERRESFGRGEALLEDPDGAGGEISPQDQMPPVPAPTRESSDSLGPGGRGEERMKRRITVGANAKSGEADCSGDAEELSAAKAASSKHASQDSYKSVASWFGGKPPSASDATFNALPSPTAAAASAQQAALAKGGEALYLSKQESRLSVGSASGDIKTEARRIVGSVSGETDVKSGKLLVDDLVIKEGEEEAMSSPRDAPAQGKGWDKVLQRFQSFKHLQERFRSGNLFAPLDGGGSVGASADQAEELSALHKVMGLPSDRRVAAARMVKRMGGVWADMTWAAKLKACRDCEDREGKGEDAGNGTLSRSSSSTAFSGDSVLPKLRERHSSMGCILDLCTVSEWDAAHAEIELMLGRAAFSLCAGDRLSQDHVDSPSLLIDILPTPHLSGPQENALTMILTARRHGLDTSLSIGSLAGYAGAFLDVDRRRSDARFLSTASAEISEMLMSSGTPSDVLGMVTPVPKDGFMKLSLTTHESGHGPKGSADLVINLKVDCMAVSLEQGVVTDLARSAPLFLSMSALNALHQQAVGLPDLADVQASPSTDVTLPGGVEAGVVIGMMTVSVGRAKLRCLRSTVEGVVLKVDTRSDAKQPASVRVSYVGVHAVEHNGPITTVLGPQQQVMLPLSLEPSLLALTPVRHTPVPRSPGAASTPKSPLARASSGAGPKSPGGEPTFTNSPRKNAMEHGLLVLTISRGEDLAAESDEWMTRRRALEVQAMCRAAPGLVADRTFLFRTYKTCVPGEALVGFLVEKGMAHDRKDAAAMCQSLMDHSVLRNFADIKKPFEDSSAFYVFSADNGKSVPPPPRPERPWEISGTVCALTAQASGCLVDALIDVADWTGSLVPKSLFSAAAPRHEPKLDSNVPTATSFEGLDQRERTAVAKEPKLLRIKGAVALRGFEAVLIGRTDGKNARSSIAVRVGDVTLHIIETLIVPLRRVDEQKVAAVLDKWQKAPRHSSPRSTARTPVLTPGSPQRSPTNSATPMQSDVEQADVGLTRRVRLCVASVSVAVTDGMVCGDVIADVCLTVECMVHEQHVRKLKCSVTHINVNLPPRHVCIITDVVAGYVASIPAGMGKGKKRAAAGPAEASPVPQMSAAEVLGFLGPAGVKLQVELEGAKVVAGCRESEQFFVLHIGNVRTEVNARCAEEHDKGESRGALELPVALLEGLDTDFHLTVGGLLFCAGEDTILTFGDLYGQEPFMQLWARWERSLGERATEAGVAVSRVRAVHRHEAVERVYATVLQLVDALEPLSSLAARPTQDCDEGGDNDTVFVDSPSEVVERDARAFNMFVKRLLPKKASLSYRLQDAEVWVVDTAERAEQALCLHTSSSAQLVYDQCATPSQQATLEARDLIVCWRSADQSNTEATAHTMAELPQARMRISASGRWVGGGAVPRVDASLSLSSLITVRVSIADILRVQQLLTHAAEHSAGLGQPSAEATPHDAANPKMKCAWEPVTSLEVMQQRPPTDGKARPLLLPMVVRSLGVRVEGVHAVFTDCRRGGCSGVLRLPFFDVRIQDISLQMQGLCEAPLVCNLSVNLACQYFNRGLAAWEPLLEPWSCVVAVAADIDVPRVLKGEKGMVSVTVAGNDSLNVNISTALVEVATCAVAQAQQGGADGACQSGAFCPLWIRNETGQSVILACAETGTQQVVEGEDMQTVTCIPVLQSSGEGLPQLVASKLELQLDNNALNKTPSSSTFSFSLPTSIVNLDALGRQEIVANVQVHQGSGVLALHAARMIVDVSVLDGGASKLLVVRSPLLLRNLLQQPIEVMFATEHDGPAMAGRKRVQIPAGGTMIVPVCNVESCDGFSVRPVAINAAAGQRHPGYRWSTGHSLMSKDWSTHYELLTFRAVGNYAKDLTAVMHWACPPGGKMCEVSLRPPLVIENLLPCNMSYTVTTSKAETPLGAGGGSGGVTWPNHWCSELASGAMEHVSDKNMNSEMSMFMSIFIAGHGWSTPANLRRPSADVDAEDHPSLGWVTTKAQAQNFRFQRPGCRGLRIEVEVQVDEWGTCWAAVYASYWIINRTTLQVQLRQERLDDGEDVPVGVEALPLDNVADVLLSSDSKRTVDSEAPQHQARTFLSANAAPSGELYPISVGELPGSRGKSGGAVGLELLADIDTIDKLEAIEARMGEGLGEQQSGQTLQMMSFNTEEGVYSAQAGMQLRLRGTSWSQAFSITGSSSMDMPAVPLLVKDTHSIPGSRKKLVVEVGVAVRVAHGKFHRTKTVTLTPRHILVNKTPHVLDLRQEGATSITSVPPHPGNNRVVFHWAAEQKLRKNLRIALNSSAAQRSHGLWHERWSTALPIDKEGDTVIMIDSNPGFGEYYFADVQVRRFMGSVVVIVQPSATDRPQYMIENFSASTLRVYQQGVTRYFKLVRPYQSLPYAWESVLGQEPRLVVEVEGSSPLISGSYSLDEVGVHKPMSSSKGGGAAFDVSVSCDGPTLILTATDSLLHPRTVETALALAPTKSSQEKTVARTHARTRGNERWLFQVDVKLLGVGCSLVDSGRPRELLYTWLGADLRREVAGSSRQTNHGLNISLWRKAEEEGLQVSLCRLQVDNLLSGASYPVVVSLASRLLPEVDHGAAGVDMFNLTVIGELLSFRSPHFFRLIDINIKPLDVALDEGLVFALLEYGYTIAQSVAQVSRRVKGGLTEEEGAEGKLGGVEDRALEAAVAGSGFAGALVTSKFYLHQLHVHPLRLTISYAPAVTALAVNSLMSLQHFVASSRFFFQNLEDLPVYLSELRLQHSFSTGSALMTRIRDHYLQQYLIVASRAVGSTNFIGNPLGLVNSISTGVVDLFKQPARELERGLFRREGRSSILQVSGDVMRGLARGTRSLFRHSVLGWCESISKASSTGARFFAFLSMDEEFAANITRDWHDRDDSQRIGMIAGILVGIGGLARLPMVGWQRGWRHPSSAGQWALIKAHGGPDALPTTLRRLGAALPLLVNGAIKAVASLLAKPVAGALDAISVTALEMMISVQGGSVVRWRRMRPPRTFGHDLVLRPLVYKESHASQLLARVDGGRFAGCSAIDYFELWGGGHLIVTPLYLVCMEARNTRSALWSTPTREVLCSEHVPDDERSYLHADDKFECAPNEVPPAVYCSSGALLAITCMSSVSDMAKGRRSRDVGVLKTYYVLCTTDGTMHRLQRTLTAMFEALNTPRAQKPQVSLYSTRTSLG